MTETAVRDFAGKLERMFQRKAQADCACSPKRVEDHEKPCPGYYWEASARAVKAVAAE